MTFIKETIKEHTDALYVKVVGTFVVTVNAIGFGVFIYFVG